VADVNEDQVLTEDASRLGVHGMSRARPTPDELGAMTLGEWRDYLMAEWSHRPVAELPDSPDHAPD
jgi:hypothetical protein